MATTFGAPTKRATTAAPYGGGNLWARWVNIILGVWLFISTWVWPHTQSAATNTWILGVIIAAVGIAALWAPAVRWINTAAAIWLFISTFTIAHVTSGTVWNNAIVAVIVFIMSLVPSPPLDTGVGRHHRGAATAS